MEKRGSILLGASIFLIIISLGVIALSEFYISMENNNVITGMASDVGVISLFILPHSNMTINLSTGWNFVSFYANMTNYTIEKVLEPIEGDYQYIQEWNSNNQDFKVWSRNGAKEFTSFDMNKSYFIFMSVDKVLSIDGAYFGNFSIELVQGWETPDYVYDYPSNISGNQFYNATFYYIQKWDVPSQEFMVYSVLANSQPFTSIRIAEGYFIRTEGGRVAYIRAP